MKAFLLSLSFACVAAGAAVAQGQAPASTTNPQEETSATQTYTAAEPEKGTIRIGAGLAFGSKAGVSKDDERSGGVGINIGGEYFLTENISVAPSFTHFFKSEVELSSDYMSTTFVSSVKVSEVNVDGRYYFGEGSVTFYGLAGLSLVSVNAKTTIKENGKVLTDASGSEFGLNLGGGVMYPLTEKLNLHGQLKYNTPAKQVVLQAGVTFPIQVSF